MIDTVIDSDSLIIDISHTGRGIPIARVQASRAEGWEI